MDSASLLLFPGTAWEHWRGFSWGFVGKIRGGWAGGGPWARGLGPNPIRDYLRESLQVGGYSESRPPGRHSLPELPQEGLLNTAPLAVLLLALH